MPTVLKGDPTKLLTVRQRHLIERFQDRYTIVGLFVSQHRTTYQMALHAGMSESDVESECWQGVVRAAQLFDPSFGAKFSTYALYWMRSKVARAVDVCQRARARSAGSHLFDGDWRSACGLEGWEILGVASRESDPAEAAELAELRDMVAGVLRQLTPKYRRIFELRYGLGPERRPMTLDEVAGVYGVTRQRVQQVVRKCLRRVREPLRRVAAVVDGCGIP